VVPNLIVFLVVERLFIQKFDFRAEIRIQGEEDFGAVEPVTVSSEIFSTEGVGMLPDCVMRWIHLRDVLGDLQRSLTVLLLGHDGAEVGHCLRILFRVGNLGQRPIAIVLWYRDEILPVWIFLVHGDCDIWGSVVWGAMRTRVGVVQS
jgi:hypothetical protein